MIPVTVTTAVPAWQDVFLLFTESSCLWGLSYGEKKNQGSSVCWAVNGINSNGMQLNVRNVQREGLRGESNRFRKLFLQPYFGWVGFSCFCLVLSDKIFWASWNLKWEGSWSLSFTLLLFLSLFLSGSIMPEGKGDWSMVCPQRGQSLMVSSAKVTPRTMTKNDKEGY